MLMYSSGYLTELQKSKAAMNLWSEVFIKRLSLTEIQYQYIIMRTDFSVTN